MFGRLLKHDVSRGAATCLVAYFQKVVQDDTSCLAQGDVTPGEGHLRVSDVMDLDEGYLGRG